MIAHWFYLVGGLCFVIGAAFSLGHPSGAEDIEEDDDPEPWGFAVRDGGICDGGNYDGWEDE